jgi:hypothetical protein
MPDMFVDTERSHAIEPARENQRGMIRFPLDHAPLEFERLMFSPPPPLVIV